VTDVVVATLVPLLLLGGIVALGRGGRRSAPVVLIALAWGVVVTWIVAPINDRWAAALGITSLITLGAPIIEEIGKGFVLPGLTASRRSSWFVDGAVFGLAAGTGFAIRENWVYLDRAADGTGIALAIARVSSTNLMHAGCSAIVGAALAAAVRRGVLQRVVVAVAALVIAMSLHAVFNRLTDGDASAAVVTMVGVGVFVVAVGIVGLGFPISVRWARQEMANRGLSEAEQVALGGGGAVDDLLDELERRFGSATAEAAEELIGLQRRIGILAHRNGADDAEVMQLTALADGVRRKIGVFPMTWLRSHLPVSPAESGVWADLGTIADDGAETGSPPSGLWASIGAATGDTAEPGGFLIGSEIEERSSET
jgi:RsiW-degrading membrane proteinase PrsW (M82 family)